ncbi:MAG: hypothetical protein IJ634_05660 [Bacteroidales bacterium]|nr:hypothetical protein [Bacteroidales bacterium]
MKTPDAYSKSWLSNEKNFASLKNVRTFASANRKKRFAEKEAFYAPYSSDVKLDTLHKENKG